MKSHEYLVSLMDQLVCGAMYLVLLCTDLYPLDICIVIYYLLCEPLFYLLIDWKVIFFNWLLQSLSLSDLDLP
jgi:hypothetical protein